ncbi:MAG: GNAT family N-acetyltransferase [Candidatus Brocadiia bacterium]
MSPRSVSPEECTLRGVRTREEALAVADLYGKAFDGYEWHYKNYRDVMLRRVPREQWRLSRTLWSPDGEPVAQVRVCHRVMRLGAAKVRVGGIGDVCTHPFHRKQGLMRHLFAHVLEFLREEPYDLSLLWGIPRFYDQFGFIAALDEGTLQVPRRQVARLQAPLRGRNARRADAPAIRRLFRADARSRDGAMDRPTDLWLKRAIRDRDIRVLADAQGRPAAYYRARPADDLALLLDEVSLGARPSGEGVVAVLADMAKVAKRHEKANLRFALPPRHPIGRFLVADGCQVRRHTGHRGGAMARIACLRTLCQAMAGEWERLLAASPAAGWSGRLRLRAEPDTLDLAISEGRVEPVPKKGRAAATITATQDKLARLVLGFHSPGTAVWLGEAKISRAARPLAEALFPRRSLLIFPADHF